jgi:hypothetical protein
MSDSGVLPADIENTEYHLIPLKNFATFTW